MNKYIISLSRSYLVTIMAEDKENAGRYAEYFIGVDGDLSEEKDRQKYKFTIEHIEMTVNEATDIHKDE